MKYTEKCYTTKVKTQYFTSVTVQENNSVCSSLAGTLSLGFAWRRKIQLPMGEENYNIVGKYGYEVIQQIKWITITTMFVVTKGRHLVMMPH
jgi:phosphoribosylformylglycinamidine synthase